MSTLKIAQDSKQDILLASLTGIMMPINWHYDAHYMIDKRTIVEKRKRASLNRSTLLITYNKFFNSYNAVIACIGVMFMTSIVSKVRIIS